MKIVFAALSLVFFSASLLASPFIPVGKDEIFVTGTENNEIKIMSYNVLNLFDSEKDLNAEDWEWLPSNYPGKREKCDKMTDQNIADFCRKIDWTQEKVDQKIAQIKKVIDYQGSKPDILALVEIENENVISMVAKATGYSHFYVTDSGTRRGVDVALLYNEKPGFKSTGWASIDTVSDAMHKGRDLLRADFVWNGKTFSVYVNHWVSQGGPTEARIKDAYAMRNDMEEQIKLNPDFSAVAVGDFNTTANEMPNAFTHVLFDISWKDAMIPLDLMARKSKTNPSLEFTPPGSHYYGKNDEWHLFDRVVGTKNLNDGKGIEFVEDSYRLPFPMFMSFSRNLQVMQDELVGLNDDLFNDENAERVLRTPLRYDFFTKDQNKRGFSDHLPLIFKLKQ